MASSKLVTTNTDLPRESSSPSSSSSSSTLLSHSPPSSSHHHHLLTHSSSMDDLLNSIYTPQRPSSSPSPPHHHHHHHHPKSVDDVWKDMILTHSHRASSGSADGDHHALEEMTLEAFLTKAGTVREEDVAAITGVIPPPPPPPPPASHHNLHHQHLPQFPVAVEGSSSSVVEPFGNGIDGGAATVVEVPPPSSSTKGKRRAVEEPVDKATLQKQKRMIKNRESAARSRERKQAYTTELECLVQQLEMENARLLSEEAEKRKQRLKELNEFIIPVVEKRKPKKLLRTSSVQSL